MYNTNLNYSQLQTHLSYLTCLGMLKHEKGRYLTTEKGYRFLELFAQLQDILRNELTQACFYFHQSIVAQSSCAWCVYLMFIDAIGKGRICSN